MSDPVTPSPPPPSPLPPLPPQDPDWSHLPTRYRVLVAGIIGGGASTLIAPIREAGSVYLFLASAGAAVWVTTCLLAAFGVLLVWLFKECNIYKALCITAGFPSLVVNLGGNAPADKAAGSPGHPAPPTVIESAQPGPAVHPVGLLDFLVPSAHAQAAVRAPSATSAAPLTVEVNTSARVAYTAEVLDASKEVLKTFSVGENASAFVTNTVPASAAYVRIKSGSLTSGDYAVKLDPGDSTIEVDLTLSNRPKLTFLQVLGKAAASESVLTVGITARPKVDVGKEGWVYLGSWDYDHWKTLYVKPRPPGPALAVGAPLEVSFPLNLRDAPGRNGARIGIVSAGQGLKVLTSTLSGSEVWARVSVTSLAPIPPAAPMPSAPMPASASPTPQ